MSDQRAHSRIGSSSRSFVQLFFRTSIFEIIAMRGRRDVAAAPGFEALPTSVRELVMRVVRRARLWRHERADVAAELASHFREGLARGESEDALVRGFGNERVAARLIRRGMRRKRPLAWKVWFYWSRGLATLLVLLVVLYLLLYGRALIDTPSIKRNYLAEWNAATLATPESDRAVSLYIKANHAIVNAPGVKDGTRFMVERDPTERGYKASEAFLDANPQIVPLIREATRRATLGIVLSDADPYPNWTNAAEPNDTPHPATPTQNPILIGVLYPHLGPMRQMSRILAQDAAIAFQRGDSVRVLDDWQALLRMARHSAENMSLIGQLNGFAVLDMTLNDVIRVLGQRPDFLSREQLRELAHSISAASLRAQPGDLSIEFAKDGDFIEDFVQRTFTDDGNGDGRFSPRGLSATGVWWTPGENPLDNVVSKTSPFPAGVGPAAPIAVLLSSGRRETLAVWHEYRTAAEAERRIPLHLIDPANTPTQEVWRKHKLDAPVSRHFILSVVLPSLGRVISSEWQIRQVREAALAAIGLCAYRAEHGDWPLRLEQLVPSVLPSVPADFFDGGVLKYRVADGSPRLYSVGSDGADNAGTPAATADGASSAASPARRKQPRAANYVECDAVYWPVMTYPKPSPPLE